MRRRILRNYEESKNYLQIIHLFCNLCIDGKGEMGYHEYSEQNLITM